MTTIPGHAAGAFLAVELISLLDPSLNSNSALAVGVLSGIFPDIDSLFFIHRMRDHHNSPLHAPLFWLFIFMILLPINHGIYIIAALTGIVSHLALDWYAGRIAGLVVFYPFSMKRYSLFPLGADAPMFSKRYNQFYMSNKVLLFSEIFIVLGAFLVLILKLIK